MYAPSPIRQHAHPQPQSHAPTPPMYEPDYPDDPPVYEPYYPDDPPVYEPDYPDDPPAYKFSYSVDDDYTGAVFTVEESRDQDHTQGSYQVR